MCVWLYDAYDHPVRTDFPQTHTFEARMDQRTLEKKIISCVVCGNSRGDVRFTLTSIQ